MTRPVRRALVVDIDETQREYCREVLEGEGFEVLLGARCEDVTAQFEAGGFDALVMDLFLEDGPSYPLLGALPIAQTAVVGLTSVFQGPTVRAILQARYPFDGLLDKPLAGSQLVDLLRVRLGDRYPQPPAPFTLDELGVGPDVDRPPSAPGIKPLPEPGAEGGARALNALLAHEQALREAGLQGDSSGQERTAVRPVHAARLAAESTGLHADRVLDLPPGLDWKNVPDSGDLTTVSFGALMSRLYHTHFSGVLRLWRERVRKVIVFREGCPVEVRSNLLYESLGRLLVRERMIDEATCQAALDDHEPGERLGATLVRQGALTQQKLDVLLRRQLEVRLFDIFGWSDGQYHISEERPTLADGPGLGRSRTLRLIINGVLFFTRLERVMRDMRDMIHLRVRPRVDPRQLERLELRDDHMVMAREIRQSERSTLLELVARFEEGSQAYQFVYALTALGYVGFG